MSSSKRARSKAKHRDAQRKKSRRDLNKSTVIPPRNPRHRREN